MCGCLCVLLVYCSVGYRGYGVIFDLICYVGIGCDNYLDGCIDLLLDVDSIVVLCECYVLLFW